MLKRIAVGGAFLLAAGCSAVPGKAIPIAPAPPPQTQTVVVQPPVTVTVPPPAAQANPPRDRTACQWMHATGYSYSAAYQAWLAAGSPRNWDADRDGWPCEQTYGNQN